MAAVNDHVNTPPEPRGRPKALALRVLAVQAITLLLLWLLQQTFGS